MLCYILLLLSFALLLFYREQAARKTFFRKLQEDETAYYEKLSLLLQQTTALQHDIKNHLYVLNAYIENQNYTHAQNYLQNLLHTNALSFPHISSPDKTLSAILSIKLYQCQNAQIPFHCQLSFSRIYQLQPFDMTTIFTNLLDNAISACQDVSLVRRYIRLSVVQADTYLYITCENSCTKIPVLSPDLSFQTEDLGAFPPCRPGIGLQNVKKALKAYNGTMEIKKGRQDFFVTILLPNHPF